MLRKFRIKMNEKEYLVEMEELTPGGTPAAAPPVAAPAEAASAPAAAPAPAPAAAPAPAPVSVAGGTVIESPMPGTILSIKVKVGDQVAADQCLVILEAMKMENEIVAPQSGTVAAIHVSEGAAIDVGKPIITIN